MAPFYGIECELTLGKSFALTREVRKLKRGDSLTLREGLIGESRVIVVNDNDAVIEKTHPRFKPIACELKPVGSNGVTRQVVSREPLFRPINLLSRKSVIMEGSSVLLEWRKK